MSFDETFRDAVDSLTAHKLRAGLSMLGMIFGVGAVIAMLSIGEGAEQQALEMIERLGLRNIVVNAKELAREDLMEIREKSPGLTTRDIDAIEEAVPGVEWVAPRVRVEPYKVIADGAKTEGMAYGVSWRHFELGSLRLAEGRFLDRQDERTHAQVCVIGAKVAEDLFGYELPLGRALKVNDVWLEVVGVLEADTEDARSFQGVNLSSTSGEIYMPYSTALRKFDHPPLDSPLDQIVVRVAEDASPWEDDGGDRSTPRAASRRRGRLHDRRAGSLAGAKSANAAALQDRHGLYRRNLTPRRRDWDHEHHAGECPRADARDRSAPRRGSAARGHPVPVHRRVVFDQLDGWAGRHLHGPSDRVRRGGLCRLADARHRMVDRSVQRRLGDSGSSVWALPRDSRCATGPCRCFGLRVGTGVS